MAEYFQWVSRRAGSDVAFSFGAPAEIEPFLETIWAGQRLVDAPPIIRVKIEAPFTGRLTDDVTALDHHCLFLSAKLLELLQAHGVDTFDTQPCQIIAGTEPTARGVYSLMVIREVIYCLDWNDSELELDVENSRIIESIESLAIDETRAGGSPLFRLGEDRQIVIVHASLAEAIQKGNCSGVEFVPVDGSVPLPAAVDQVGGEWPDFVIEYCEGTGESGEID